MANVVTLDAETRSLLDLRKVGAARYARHPSTDVWCVGYAIDDQPVQIWLPGEPVPPAIIEAAANPNCNFVAHNAGGFEYPILEHILTPRYSWPNIPIERWHCTMTMGLVIGLPSKLKKIAAVAKLKHQKADDKVMRLMTKPRRPRVGEDPKGTYWFDDPKHQQALRAYCKQDVECEHELYHWLPPLSPALQEQWCVSETIGDRGFHIDRLLLDKAITIAVADERAVQDELRQITGGKIETTHQVEKIIAWLAAHDCVVTDLQKSTLAHALRRTNLSPEVRRVIQLRQDAAHTSARKMQTLRDWCCLDGRVRGAFVFHKATTGRWASLGPQIQNLRRETENTAAKFSAVMSGDLVVVRALGAPMEVVGDIARAAPCAAPGYRLVSHDFSAIESRFTAFIADETDKLARRKQFDRSGDPRDEPYFQEGIAIGRSEKTARQYGKVADLAFGYGGGINAFKNLAPEDDTTSDLEIENYKRAWRARHPNTVQFWHGIERAAINAVHRPLTVVRYGRLFLECRPLHEIPFLFIKLPSGRELPYPFVKLIRNSRGFPAVSFMDNQLGKWVEVRGGRGVWGGTFTENIVQALARDALAAAMMRLEANGYPVVLHVHDQIVCELANGT
jgi:DNA polymerase